MYAPSLSGEAFQFQISKTVIPRTSLHYVPQEYGCPGGKTEPMSSCSLCCLQVQKELVAVRAILSERAKQVRVLLQVVRKDTTLPKMKEDQYHLTRFHSATRALPV